jgi:hypothetical protein
MDTLADKSTKFQKLDIHLSKPTHKADDLEGYHCVRGRKSHCFDGGTVFFSAICGALWALPASVPDVHPSPAVCPEAPPMDRRFSSADPRRSFQREEPGGSGTVCHFTMVQVFASRILQTSRKRRIGPVPNTKRWPTEEKGGNTLTRRNPPSPSTHPSTLVKLHAFPSCCSSKCRPQTALGGAVAAPTEALLTEFLEALLGTLYGKAFACVPNSLQYGEEKG